MPRNIFDDDAALLDYGSIDEMSEMGLGTRGFVNVDPLDGDDWTFNDDFRERASELTRRPSNLEPVYILPLKNGMWSGNNQLGTLQRFQTNAQNEQTILKLDEWGFPRVWTVHLEMEYDATVPSTFDVIAKVTAGIGGNTIDFEVDWSKGASFSFAFNALNVVAKFNDATNPPSDLRLGVNIGHYPKPGARPTRTFTNLLCSAGGFIFLTVPRFAKYYRILPTAGPGSPFAATVQIGLFGSGTGGIFKYNFLGGDYFTFNPEGKVAIPGSTQDLFIFNPTPDDFNATIEFELGLGDGS